MVIHCSELRWERETDLGLILLFLYTTYQSTTGVRLYDYKAKTHSQAGTVPEAISCHSPLRHGSPLVATLSTRQTCAIHITSY